MRRTGTLFDPPGRRPPTTGGLPTRAACGPSTRAACGFATGLLIGLASVLVSGCAVGGASGGLGRTLGSEEEAIQAAAAQDHFPTAAQAGIVSRPARQSQ